MGKLVVSALVWKIACYEQCEGIQLMHHIATATSDLEITVNRADESTLMCLRGRLDIDSSPALRDRLLDLLRGQSTETVVVDLAAVSYIDASGIATLVEALKMSCSRGGAFRLKGLQGRLLHLFEVTGVLSLFEMNGCITPSSALKVS